jgi:hypothetical protein
MSNTNAQGFTVLATAKEVMPKFGLAFVADDEDTVWGLTHTTPGPGLSAIEPGKRVRLTVRRYPRYSLVESYQRLD